MEKVTEKIEEKNEAIQELAEQVKNLKEQPNKSLWGNLRGYLYNNY